MSASAASAIQIEVIVRATPEVVYRHLTEPALLQRWFAKGAPVEAVPGGRVWIPHPHGQANVGRVVTVGPPHLLRFTWSFERPLPDRVSRRDAGHHPPVA